MPVTIWYDHADMKTKVKTSAGILLDETGRPANIMTYEDAHSGRARWNSPQEAVQHFARVDAKLRSL